MASEPPRIGGLGGGSGNDSHPLKQPLTLETGVLRKWGAMTAILERTPVSYALPPINGTSIFGSTVGAIGLRLETGVLRKWGAIEFNSGENPGFLCSASHQWHLDFWVNRGGDRVQNWNLSGSL